MLQLSNISKICLHEGQKLYFSFYFCPGAFQLCHNIPDSPTARVPGGNDKQMTSFPQNKIHMRIRIAASLAKTQNGSSPHWRHTWTDCVVDQVWKQFLCLKWNRPLVYMPLRCLQWEKTSCQNREQAASFSDSSLFHVGTIIQVAVLTEWLHWVCCAYPRPVWIEAMLGSQEELPAPSSSSSCL